MFQTDNERDYSGTMSGIPIEPLLTIIKNRDTVGSVGTGGDPITTTQHTSSTSSYAITDYTTDEDPTTSNSINNIMVATPLNDKMKTRISRSSDSGYPNSPSLIRERSLRRQHRGNSNDDSDSSSTDIGVSVGSVANTSTTSTFPRNISATKTRTSSGSSTSNKNNHYNSISGGGHSHKNEHIPLTNLEHSSSMTSTTTATSNRIRSRSLNSSADNVLSSSDHHRCSGSGSSSSSATLNPRTGAGGVGGRYSESDSSGTIINNGNGSAVKMQRRISKGSNCSSTENNTATGGLTTTNSNSSKTAAASIGTGAGSGSGGGGIVARHIAMRMLAASSRSFKLQEELAKPRILKLLLDCLLDPDDEIILQAAETLANIAMNIETHLQLQVENTEEGLYKLLEHADSRVQYQAARGLVYLGYQDVNGRYIYNYIPAVAHSSSTVVYMEEEGRSHIRGTTVENLVLTLTQTKGIYLLWGGAHNLPPSPVQRKSSRHHHHHHHSTSLGKVSSSAKTSVPSENQIVNFILSTYQTFVHPIIFMRLLLHRFREPAAYERFAPPKLMDDGESDDDTGCGGVAGPGSGPMEHYAPLPIVHARLMRVWIAWLEHYADDFRTFPTLRDELSVLIGPMRSIDGPYAPCASRLEQLLAKVAGLAEGSWPANTINVYHFESESHHNILYEQCYKVIKNSFVRFLRTVVYAKS